MLYALGCFFGVVVVGGFLRGLLVFFISILISCTQKSQFEVKPELGLLEAEQVISLSAIDISCQNSEECHPSVGGLFSLKKKFKGDERVGYCTAFLVQPDRIMTNSHCIGDYEKDRGDLSEESKYFVLPASKGFAAESLQVISVESLSDIKKNAHLDWAILRLERASQRKPIQVSAEGIENEVSYSFYKVDPLGEEQNMFQIVSMQCLSYQHSWLHPFYDNPYEHSVSFRNCPMIVGNSGAPVIDGEGVARGILYGKATPYDEEIEEWISSKIFESVEGINTKNLTMALVSNFSCVPFANAKSKIGLENCSLKTDSKVQKATWRKYVGKIKEEQEQEVVKMIERWKQEEGRRFQWVFEHDNESGNVVSLQQSRPACFRGEFLKEILEEEEIPGTQLETRQYLDEGLRPYLKTQSIKTIGTFLNYDAQTKTLSVEFSSQKLDLEECPQETVGIDLI